MWFNRSEKKLFNINYVDRKTDWLSAGQVSSKLSLPKALLLTCPHLSLFKFKNYYITVPFAKYLSLVQVALKFFFLFLK